MFQLFPSFVDICFCICAACWAEFQWDGMYSFSEDNEIRSWVPDYTDAWGLAEQTQVYWYGNVSEPGTPVVQAIKAIGKCGRKDNPGSQQNHGFLSVESLSNCRMMASG